MWVAISGVSTAVAIFIPLIWSKIENKKAQKDHKQELSHAFISEVKRNIKRSFQGGLETTFENDIYQQLKREIVIIANKDLFNNIADIYSYQDYYQNILKYSHRKYDSTLLTERLIDVGILYGRLFLTDNEIQQVELLESELKHVKDLEIQFLDTDAFTEEQSISDKNNPSRLESSIIDELKRIYEGIQDKKLKSEANEALNWILTNPNGSVFYGHEVDAKFKKREFDKLKSLKISDIRSSLTGIYNKSDLNCLVEKKLYDLVKS